MIQYHKIHGLYKRYTEGEKKGKFIMGEYSKPEFKLLKDINWVWTEKVDGTNIRVQIFRCPLVVPHIEFHGKTERAEIPEHLLAELQKLFTEEKVLSLFPLSEEAPDVCLYGEGYGYKIQKGSKYMHLDKAVGFVLFDVKIGSTWLKREDVREIGDKLLIPTVPIIDRGTIQEAIDYVKMAPNSWFGNRDFVMEGLVVRPEHELLDRRGHRIITKIKYRDFKEGE